MRDIFRQKGGEIKEKNKRVKFLLVFFLSFFLFQSVVSASSAGVQVKESLTKSFVRTSMIPRALDTSQHGSHGVK